MTDSEAFDSDISITKPRSERQLARLVSICRLSHHRAAPWSSWSILYSRRRRRSKSPMFCLDSQAFEVVTKTQEQQLEARQLHRQRIRQHVQERLAEQNNVVEQDGVISHASPILPDGIVETESLNAFIAVSSPAGAAPGKRSIRWNLMKNTTKNFYKEHPITLVSVPAKDRKPTKSALKVRTAATIHKSHTEKSTIRVSAGRDTGSKSSAQTKPVRKHAVDFF